MKEVFHSDHTLHMTSSTLLASLLQCFARERLPHSYSRFYTCLITGVARALCDDHAHNVCTCITSCTAEASKLASSRMEDYDSGSEVFAMDSDSDIDSPLILGPKGRQAERSLFSTPSVVVEAASCR